jgi:hypothetical protein
MTIKVTFGSADASKHPSLLETFIQQRLSRVLKDNVSDDLLIICDVPPKSIFQIYKKPSFFSFSKKAVRLDADEMKSIATYLLNSGDSLFKETTYSETKNSIMFTPPKPKQQLRSENELQEKKEEISFIKECYKTMYIDALNDKNYERCAKILLAAGSAKIFLEMPAPLHSEIFKAFNDYLTSSSRSLGDFDYDSDSDNEDTNEDKTEKGKIVRFYTLQSETLRQNSAPGNLGGTTSQYASVTSSTNTSGTNSNATTPQQKLNK